MNEKKHLENAKTFYSNVAGSFFVCADGTRINFTGGMAVVSNPEHIAELDALCKTPGQYMIYDVPVATQNHDPSVRIMRELGAPTPAAAGTQQVAQAQQEQAPQTQIGMVAAPKLTIGGADTQ